ncbi:MAG: DUF4258 domain-containing protein [Candidatus Desantisbacteria bacterium]
MIEFKEKLFIAYKKKLLFTIHALNQMNLPERMISKDEVKDILDYGEIIEYYQDDPRGEGCLMYAIARTGRPIHVVCSPKQDCLAIVSTYIPTLNIWENDYKTRRRR